MLNFNSKYWNLKGATKNESVGNYLLVETCTWYNCCIYMHRIWPFNWNNIFSKLPIQLVLEWIIYRNYILYLIILSFKITICKKSRRTTKTLHYWYRPVYYFMVCFLDAIVHFNSCLVLILERFLIKKTLYGFLTFFPIHL